MVDETRAVEAGNGIDALHAEEGICVCDCWLQAVGL